MIPSQKDLEKFWAIAQESLDDVEVKLPRSRKRIQWPIDDELLEMIENSSNSAMVRKVGSSEAVFRMRVAKINAKLAVKVKIKAEGGI